MTEFLEALRDPLFPFLRYSLTVGLLASVAFGILGSYVVVRRVTYLADAIAHCVLGGIGAALFLNWNLGLTWVHPMLGAVVVAVLAALGIGLISLYAREREDTVISVVWVLGMAVGLLLLERLDTPPGQAPVEPMSYLFGDILLISKRDLWLVLGLDAVILAIVILFRNKLLAVCFDEEFATLRGVHSPFYYLLLLCLVAVTVVLLVRVVGMLLVVAMMALPAATGGFFGRRLWQMMVAAVVCCAVLMALGLAVSFTYELRTGPTVIVLAGAAYLITAALSRMAHIRA
ncbi:MAG: metal ABC transporter permease [Planctomycetota bacterium]